MMIWASVCSIRINYRLNATIFPASTVISLSECILWCERHGSHKLPVLRTPFGIRNYLCILLPVCVCLALGGHIVFGTATRLFVIIGVGPCE
jgi:hypothetical protein